MVAKIGVVIPDGSAQYTPDDIPCSGIGGQLSIGYSEADRPNVVCDDTEGNILFCILKMVCVSGNSAHLLDGSRKHIGIVVAGFLLDDANQSFKAHACVHVHGRQWLESTV